MAMRYKRLLILVFFVVILVLFFIFDGSRYLSLEQFQRVRGDLVAMLDKSPLLFLSAFFGTYVVVTALSLPAASAVTIVGGALVGWPLATAIVVPAATLGSIVPFLAARFVIKDFAERKFETAFRTLNKGIDESGWWYLLSARLSAIIPFYVLNLAAGVARIPLKDYVSATLLGIIPGTLVFTYAGSQLGTSTETGNILRPGVLLALLLLAATPIIIRHFQKKLLAKTKGKGV